MRAAGKAVMLPRIGRVAMVEELRFRGSVREVTINRTAGRWFASFCVEDGQPVPPVKAGPTIGVDVGVGTLAECSNGMKVENPKALKGALRRLRRVDKAIARSRNVHGRSNPSNRVSVYTRNAGRSTPGSSRSGMTITTRPRPR